MGDEAEYGMMSIGMDINLKVAQSLNMSMKQIMLQQSLNLILSNMKSMLIIVSFKENVSDIHRIWIQKKEIQNSLCTKDILILFVYRREDEIFDETHCCNIIHWMWMRWTKMNWKKYQSMFGE